MANNKSNDTKENVLTYEQRRLAYFRAQLKKAEAKCVRLKRLCGSKEVGSYIAEDARLLNNAMAECSYYKDVVELLEQMPRHDDSCNNSNGIHVPGLEMPCTCNDCIFLCPYEYFPTGNSLYKKVSHCMFAPEDMENPWRSGSWLSENKEDWCPLISVRNTGKP